MRAPNHLGDVIMALPGLAAAGHDVMVVHTLVPVLEMARLPVRVLPLVRGFRGFWDAVGRLRRSGYDRGILMSAAFSAALLFRVGGVARLRGTATDGRTPLLADPIPRERLGKRHRILQYRFLLEQNADPPPVPHGVTPPEEVVQKWRDRLAVDHVGPLVALFPGSNAPSRRWPAHRFAELGRRLASEGARVAVLGGPDERRLTADVAEAVPGSHDLGGRTDLVDLAAVLSLSRLMVTNDTGPMHLAGVVGTPTVTLWGPSSPGEVRPVGAGDVQVSGGPIPCMPCKKNHCPRSGEGTILPEARDECMKLIEVDAVADAVRRALS